MVLVSHKYKFIYIKNRKVAGSSVESFFGQFCINPVEKYSFDDSIAEHIDDYGIIGSRTKLVSLNDKWKNHKSAISIKTDLGDDTFNQYIKFCVIRNPYDIMVSAYFFYTKAEENTSFKEFSKKKRINNFEIYSINGNSVCDYYIRYENLQEDIVKMCTILNINNYDINDLPTHKSEFRDKQKHYREYYDEETRKIVYENHKKEFELFGYTF